MSNDHKIDERFVAESWDNMNVLLDKEMPIKKKKRLLFLLLPFLGLVLMGLGIYFIMDSKAMDLKDKVAQKNELPLLADRIVSKDVRKAIEKEEEVLVYDTPTQTKEPALNTKFKNDLNRRSVNTTRVDKNNSKSLVKVLKQEKLNEKILFEGLDDVSKASSSKTSTASSAKVNTNIDSKAFLLDLPGAQEEQIQNNSIAKEKLYLQDLGFFTRHVTITERVVPEMDLLPLLVARDIVAPLSSNSKNSFDVVLAGNYAFENQFKGLQGILRYNYGLSDKWFLSSSLGLSRWFKEFYTALSDPSTLNSPSGEFIPTDVGTSKFMDINTSMGFSYSLDNWMFNSGLRYRRFFNFDYGSFDQYYSDAAGIGLDDKESLEIAFNSILDSRKITITRNMFNPFVSLSYTIKNRLGLELGTEFSSTIVDINGIESKPIYFSGAMFYSF